MATINEQFISNFHALSGVTIGERRKELFLLLNKSKESGCTQLDFASLQPKTPLEENFRVEVLIYFRRSSELVDLLKCENPIVIHKILNSKSGILEEVFQNITGEQLVTILLPYVSFNTKVKLINKVTLFLRNPQQADSFYCCVERKYGLYLACKLLPACSPELIMNCIKSSKIKLAPRQLLVIIKKHPQIAEDVIKQLSSNFTDFAQTLGQEYKQILMFLAKHDTLLYLKLYKQYNLSLHLGWRVTDKLIRANKEKVTSSPNTYLEFLHHKQIPKSLTKDFQVFYINLFPKLLEQLEDSYSTIFSLFKHLPLKMKDLDLLLNAFQRTYGCQLWDHAKFVTPELLEMLSPDEREKRMKIECKPSSMSEDEWHCYSKMENAIPYLKKRISLSSDIKTRADLMGLLAKTCKINNDMTGLAEACKYVVKQHRNDHMSVRLSFLRVIRKNFQLQNLGEEHWSSINELIKIFVLNDETFYHRGEFIEGYIHYRLIHRLPIQEQLTDWVKTQWEGLNLIKANPDYEKQCLAGFAEVIPQAFTGAELKTWNIRFLSALMDWNKRHRKDQISLFAYAGSMLSLKEILAEEGYVYNAETVVSSCLRQKIDPEEKASLLKAFLSMQDCYNIRQVAEWLIKYDPLLILQSVEALTQSMLKTQHVGKGFFWKHCRNYSHTEIPSKVIEVCLNEYQTDAEQDIKLKNAILALSYVMSANEFLKFVVPYYPSELRMDTKSDDGKKLVKLQKAVGANIKNVNPPSLGLESVLIFCKGDYLRLIQRSLYSVASNTNEDKLAPVFGELLRRSVSVRKHAMHLTFRVLDKDQIWSVLNRFMESEKNASVRKFIFKCSFNFFVKNPSDYSWDLVKLSANSVDSSDKEAIAVLMQVDKIPSQYLAKYIPFTWDVLSKIAESSEVSEVYKGIFLNSLTSDTVQLLSTEFCRDIIASNLFKCSGDLDYFQAAVQLFVCKYVMHCRSQTEQEELLESSFAILKSYIVATWHKADSRYSGRTCTTNYLSVLCQEFLDDNSLNKQVLSRFVDLWNNFLKPHEAFDEYLHLQFTLICVQKLPLPEIGKKLAVLCDSLAEVYGPIILGVFCNKVKFFDNYFIGNKGEDLEKQIYIIIENLILHDSSVMCLLLVILLLTDYYYPKTQETKLKYDSIIQLLESKHDKQIQMYLHKHFKSITN